MLLRALADKEALLGEEAEASKRSARKNTFWIYAWEAEWECGGECEWVHQRRWSGYIAIVIVGGSGGGSGGCSVSRHPHPLFLHACYYHSHTYAFPPPQPKPTAHPYQTPNRHNYPSSVYVDFPEVNLETGEKQVKTNTPTAGSNVMNSWCLWLWEGEESP